MFGSTPARTNEPGFDWHVSEADGIKTDRPIPSNGKEKAVYDENDDHTGSYKHGINSSRYGYK